MDPVALSPFDRRLLHTLHVTPRASFRDLAAGLGVSDRVVARRYHELTRDIGLRVLGRLDTERLGGSRWFVRLQCTPDAALAVATALARREDTAWVRLASGGAEVICVLESRDPAARDAVLLDNLSGSRRVVGITAQALLHRFSPVEWRRLTGTEPSAAEQTAATDGSVTMDETDEALVRALGIDGRTPAAALAAAIHTHESSVRRRITRLWTSGALYFDVDVEDAAIGYPLSTSLWIRVDPARLDAVGRAVAAMDAVPYVAATTGPTNLTATVYTESPGELYRFLTDKVGALPGVRQVESTPISRTLKRAGTVREH